MVDSSSSSSSELDRFKMTITTTATPETFTMPFYNKGTFNCVVYWGDGTNSNITAWDDDASHEYATAGTYQIQIAGNCPSIHFNNIGSKLNVDSVDAWGDTGFLKIDFYGCSNMTSLPNETGKLALAEDLEFFVRGCSNITTIPEGTFRGATSCTKITSGFYSSGLTSIPANLFEGLTAITNLSSCFRSCSGLTAIPEGLFDDLTGVTDFRSCFHTDTNIENIPLTLFDNCTSTIYYGACFYNNNSVATAVPELWKIDPAPAGGGTDCFKLCSSATNYEEIPESWGGIAFSSSSSSA